MYPPVVQEGRILVRAAINLSGLKLGRRAYVDPSDPWMSAALEAGHLVREEDEPDDAGAAEEADADETTAE